MNTANYNSITAALNITVDLSEMSKRDKAQLLGRLLREVRIPDVLVSRGHLEALQIIDERLTEFWQD